MVVILTVAEDDPAGTVTLAGTLATAGLSLLNETRTPPWGAGPFKETVAVTSDPPITEVGVMLIPASVGVGSTMILLDTELCVPLEST